MSSSRSKGIALITGPSRGITYFGNCDHPSNLPVAGKTSEHRFNADGSLQYWHENIRKQIPMRHIGHGEEIANAALILATTDSRLSLRLTVAGRTFDPLCQKQYLEH